MYRILLVDDETEVLSYFKHIFESHLMPDADIDIVSLDTAQKAISFINQYKVDIIISDIQMPGMTGLEMYKVIRQTWPSVKIIFLTGYMEFDHVYSTASDTNAKFLTKLEPPEKIVAVVREAIQELTHSMEQEKLLEEAQSLKNVALPLIQQNVVKQFFNNHYNSAEEIQTAFAECSLGLSPELSFLLVSGKIDKIGEFDKNSEIEHARFVCNQIFLHSFASYYHSFYYMPEMESMPGLWLLQPCAESIPILTELLENVQNEFQRATGRTISFSYMNNPTHHRQLAEYRIKMNRMLGYQPKDAVNSLIPCVLSSEPYSLLTVQEEAFASWKNLTRINELEGYLETGQKDRYFALFRLMTDGIKNTKSMNDIIAIEVFLKLSVMLIRYINLWKLNEEVAFRTDLHRLFRIDVHENWADAVSYLENTSAIIFDLYFHEEQNNLSNYIALLKNYIKKHLGDDLSLVKLADHLHLNASYLSRLFKQETGSKLYDYILEIRMNRATELILKSNKKIQDIALEVGYDSVQSFNRSFKKCTGKTPIEYRNGSNL